MTGEKTRGVINNNPLNMEKSADKWEGLATVQADPRFFQFESAPFGIRAGARELIVYQDKHGCRSITDLINRWAPPQENNTGSYIQTVAARSGFDPSVPIDMRDYVTAKAVIGAMIVVECAGYQYDDAVMDKGLLLAGIQGPQRDLQASGTVQGGKVAIAATATLGPIMAAVQQWQDFLNNAPWVGQIFQTIIAHQPKFMVGLSLIAAGAIGFMLWRRIDDHRRGLR